MKYKYDEYCCYLIGNGQFDDEYDPDFEGDTPLNLVDRPCFFNEDSIIELSDDNKWNLFIGITCKDETFRQPDDIKDFLTDAYNYLDNFITYGTNNFTILMHYENKQKSMFQLDDRTMGLMSSLRIQLEIYL